MLDSAVARMPAFMFVAGESGVGKSRLVSEFEARAGVPVLVGHCLELGGTTFPYAPLVEALRPLGESVPEASSQAQVFEALLALLDRLGPVALVIEDLHWADPSTRDFLVFLVRNARTEPLFLLATYRSDELHRRHPLRPVLAELERAPRVERIALERFTRSEVNEQLTGILGDEPDPGLADRLYARAQGNALYTEELLAASADGSGELPATLRDALLGRFERLPAAAQEVVRVAAVAERPFGHALLEAVLPPGEVIEGAREAVAHQLLVTHPDGTYAFRHALVGEAIYEDLLPGERTALHASAGAGARGRPRGARRPSSPATGRAPTTCRGRSRRRWRRASRRAACTRTARRCATSRTRSRCGTACRTPPSARACRRSAVLRAAGAAANDGFESARAIALMREAIADAAGADRVELAGMHSELAHYLRHANQHDASDEEVRRALELLPEDARLERARLRDQSSKSLMLRGHFREAALEAHETAAEARRLGALDLEAGAVNTEGISLRRARRTSRTAPGCCAAPATWRSRSTRRPSCRGRRPTCPSCSTSPAAPRRRWPRCGPRCGSSTTTRSARSTTPSSSSRARPSCCGWGARRRPRRRCPTAFPARRSPRRGPTTPRCARTSPCCAARTTQRAPRSRSCAGPCRPTGTRSGSRCWRR